MSDVSHLFQNLTHDGFQDSDLPFKRASSSVTAVGLALIGTRLSCTAFSMTLMRSSEWRSSLVNAGVESVVGDRDSRQGKSG